MTHATATADRLAPAAALRRKLVQWGVAVALAVAMVWAVSPRPGQAPAAEGLAASDAVAGAHQQSHAIGEDGLPPAGPLRTHPAKQPRSHVLQVRAAAALAPQAPRPHGVAPAQPLALIAPATPGGLHFAADRAGIFGSDPALRLNPGQAPPLRA